MLRQSVSELKTIAENFPQKELDLSSFKTILTDALLIPILDNAGRYLKKLILDDCQLLTDHVPKLIAEKCVNIQYLSTKRMLWQQWSTWGLFKDSRFPQLEFLSIEGCLQLKSIYIVAPKFSDHLHLVKEARTIVYKDEPPKVRYKSIAIDYTILPERKPIKEDINIKINGINIFHKIFLQEYLAKILIHNLAEEIDLDKDFPGNSAEFISILAEHIENNTSLKKLSLRWCLFNIELINPLLEKLKLNRSLEILDLSCNHFAIAKVEKVELGIYKIVNKSQAFLDFIQHHPKIKILNLSYNELGNLDVGLLYEALVINKSLTELNLAGNSIYNNGLLNLTSVFKKNRCISTLDLTDNYSFTNESLIDFFKHLTENTTLQNIAIYIEADNDTLKALANVIAKNNSLLEITIYRSKYNYRKLLITEDGIKPIVNALSKNTRLKSLHLIDFNFSEENLKILADGIKQNKILHQCQITTPKENSSEQRRIEKYCKRNKNQISSVTSSSTPSIISQLSLQTSHDSKIIPFNVPQKIPVYLQLEMMHSYLEKLQNRIVVLETHANHLDKELDRDQDTKDEMRLIYSNRKLSDYYVKLCELKYYVTASQSIYTSLVGKGEDAHAIAVKIGSITSRSLIDFIPVVSGVIEAIELADTIKGNIEKHRYASNIVRWSKGLNTAKIDSLCHRFARKMTLAKKDSLLNPNLTLQNLSLCDRLIQKAKQAAREFEEGHIYSAQEKSALIDTLAILDAIAKEEILPSIQSTESERVDEMLDAMIKKSIVFKEIQELTFPH